MNAFEFVQPRNLADAIAAGASETSAFLAGGTNLSKFQKSVRILR